MKEFHYIQFRVHQSSPEGVKKFLKEKYINWNITENIYPDQILLYPSLDFQIVVDESRNWLGYEEVYFLDCPWTFFAMGC